MRKLTPPDELPGFKTLPIDLLPADESKKALQKLLSNTNEKIDLMAYRFKVCREMRGEFK